MDEKFRKPIYLVVLQKVCTSEQMSANKYKNTMISSWRKTNYIEDPKIAKRIVCHKDIQKREASNQKIPIRNKQSHGPSNHMKKRYHDMGKGVFYQNKRSSP